MIKTANERRLGVFLATMGGVVLFGVAVALATNADDLFPSHDLSGLSSIATGVVMGSGSWAIATVIRWRDEMRRLRSQSKESQQRS